MQTTAKSPKATVFSIIPTPRVGGITYENGVHGHLSKGSSHEVVRHHGATGAVSALTFCLGVSSFSDAGVQKFALEIRVVKIWLISLGSKADRLGLGVLKEASFQFHYLLHLLYLRKEDDWLPNGKGSLIASIVIPIFAISKALRRIRT